jgi:hypothetical protein
LVDWQHRAAKRSPELSLTSVAGLGNVLWVEEMVMVVTENLTEDFFSWLNNEVRPAVTDRGGGSFLARTACWEHGKEKWS